MGHRALLNGLHQGLRELPQAPGTPPGFGASGSKLGCSFKVGGLEGFGA